MTIDEAIEFCNEKSKNIKLRTEPKTFEQIAEWLEELKANRIALEKANGYLEANCRLGYNNGIDDFMDKLLYQIGDLGIRDIIQETAEQLKVGGVNGDRY